MSTAWKVNYQNFIVPTGGGEIIPTLPRSAIVLTEKDSIEELGSTIGKLDQFKYSRIISVENNGPIHTLKCESKDLV